MQFPPDDADRIPADLVDQYQADADSCNLEQSDLRKSACLLISEISGRKMQIPFPAVDADRIPADLADQYQADAGSCNLEQSDLRNLMEKISTNHQSVKILFSSPVNHLDMRGV